MNRFKLHNWIKFFEINISTIIKDLKNYKPPDTDEICSEILLRLLLLSWYHTSMAKRKNIICPRLSFWVKILPWRTSIYWTSVEHRGGYVARQRKHRVRLGHILNIIKEDPTISTRVIAKVEESQRKVSITL